VASPSTQRAIALSVGAVLAAAAVAVPKIADLEGKRNVGYQDPAPGKYETICFGHMQPGVLGKTYTDQQCADLLAQDAVKNGLAIANCLPAELPLETRAAFISAAFNIGTGNFCTSSMSRKALAGDLPGACASLSLWIKAGSKELPGLVRRRREERALCEKGLR
jgi:lysozyme